MGTMPYASQPPFGTMLHQTAEHGHRAICWSATREYNITSHPAARGHRAICQSAACGHHATPDSQTQAPRHMLVSYMWEQYHKPLASRGHCAICQPAARRAPCYTRQLNTGTVPYASQLQVGTMSQSHPAAIGILPLGSQLRVITIPHASQLLVIPRCMPGSCTWAQRHTPAS